MGWRDGYLAVDWGTTNRRAYRLDSDGRPVDQFEDALGVTSVPPGGFAAAVAGLRTRLGDLRMLLGGMVGSDRGWQEAPYVPCPATAGDLARGLLWVEAGRTAIVPGVCQAGVAGADVMRGEEVQAIGAIAAGLAPADGLICHPGTHAKWIVTAGGRIDRFRTMMTGELFALLSRHSILAEQLGGPVRAGPAFDAGVGEALAGGDLLSGLFGIRARYLLGQSAGDEASRASGLLIGSDIRAGLAFGPAGPVTLIGRPELCELYAAALALAGRGAAICDGAIAFIEGMRVVTGELQ